jgi:UDP-N-acetylmuramate--alanine ligase
LSKNDDKLEFLTHPLKPGYRISLPESVKKARKEKAIHFVGMGGIGMSGIAKIFAELNYKISGSDIKDSPTLFSMAERGATVFVGHDAKNVEEAGLVVVSSAIQPDNPEIIKSKELGLPIVHRAQMLELLLSGSIEELTNQVSIGVTGTHGKTTTSGMLGLMFDHAGLKPTIIVGGQMPVLNSNSKLGSGKYFVAELDESDGTISLYRPDITVITNLELDHSDHYKGGLEQILDTFEEYINNLPNDSTVIVNLDSEGNRELLKRLPDKSSKILTYSIEKNAPHFEGAKFKAIDMQSEGFNSKFKVLYQDDMFGEVEIIIPGQHNISNALAAVAVGIESGLGLEKVIAGISRFVGMRRRFQTIGEINKAKIVDDYAHHPTEISATLMTAKHIIQNQGHGRVVAVFQPHRYTRLSTFWDNFTKCFIDADVVFVCDVYSANEQPIENINSEKLSACIKNADVTYVSGAIEEVAEKVYHKLQPGDLVLTLGAGSITKLGNILLEKLDRVTK